MAGRQTPYVRKLQNQWKKLSHEIAIDRPRAGLMVPKHAPGRAHFDADGDLVSGKCVKCGKFHTINEHRFHDEGSHFRTHGDESLPARVPAGGGAASKKEDKRFKLPPEPTTQARTRRPSQTQMGKAFGMAAAQRAANYEATRDRREPAPAGATKRSAKAQAKFDAEQAKYTALSEARDKRGQAYLSHLKSQPGYNEERKQIASMLRAEKKAAAAEARGETPLVIGRGVKPTR